MEKEEDSGTHPVYDCDENRAVVQGVNLKPGYIECGVVWCA